MQKTITVKGVGKASAKPDLVELSLSLESKDKNYEKAMALAGQKIAQLNETLTAVGFEKDSVKTTSFHVRMKYKYVEDRSGNSRRVFDGYEVEHRLKVSFDFDNGRLSRALSAVAGCLSKPELSIKFTVKDASAMKEDMLSSAAANAKANAEILCSASGQRLGELLSINYSWGELDIYSDSAFRIEEDCMCSVAPAALRKIEMEPEDIDVSDSVTFVWAID